MKLPVARALAFTPSTRQLFRCLSLCATLALGAAACDDDDSSTSGRDTRLEWPVDSGGFSTSDGGAPDRGSHGGDGHTHDSADAHGPATTDAQDAAAAHALLLWRIWSWAPPIGM
jgi:hypothetical protein